MEYQFEDADGVLKVSLVGRLVASCSEDFKDAMFERLRDSKRVLLNLQKMEHVDSSGLGALVSILQWMNGNGGVIKLCCLQPRPRIVFDITVPAPAEIRLPDGQVRQAEPGTYRYEIDA